jgi:hypothetical protein
MARSEIMLQIKMEPSEETLLLSKWMLELWLNAEPGRDIQVVQYPDDEHDGQEALYLKLVRGENESQTETD